MQFKSILAVSSVLIVTAASQAATVTWTGAQSSAWDNRFNWDTNVPNTTDTAVIPNVTTDPILATDVTVAAIQIQNGGNLTIDASTGVADVFTGTLNVQSGGTLSLASDADLTVTGSSGFDLDSGGAITVASGGVLEVSGAGTHAIDAAFSPNGMFIMSGGGTYAFGTNGQLVLPASTTQVNIQTNSVTFTISAGGPTKVVGQHASAQFSIANGVTLTSNPNIEGMMTFTGQGTLDAQGDVIANVAGVLLFDSQLNLLDTVNTDWEAKTSSSAVLRFAKAHTGANRLVGDLIVDDCALIDFYDVAVQTSGSYTDNGGKLDNGPGNTGTFAHTCPTPCTSVSLPDNSC